MDISTSEPSLPRVGEIAAPVLQDDRITSIDTLRGFALLGILILNIWAFSMIGAAYMNPTAYGDLTGANYWIWYFSYLLADQKFMTIFSMLFGAGLVLMTQRAEAKTGKSAGVHYRRMGWLILFGLLHAHLLWYGDILYSYGMCGLLVWLFRKVRPLILLIVGGVAVCVPSVLFYGLSVLYEMTPADGQEQWLAGMQPNWQPDAQAVQDELEAYRSGWLSQAAYRSPMAAMFQTIMLPLFIVWRAGGLMLIGMACFKTGVFNASRSYAFYAFMAAIGVGIGLPLTIYEIAQHQAGEWGVINSQLRFMSLHMIATIVQSIGYVGLVMIVCKSGALSWLRRALASVGQMALTNYLMHTIICTTIFYGHGFGQFGDFSRTEQLLLVVGIWVPQLIWSPLWLRYFRFGPFEWLWRSLTYWKPQPLFRSR